MKPFYQHLIVGWAAFLILMSTLAGEFLNGPAVPGERRSAPPVEVSTRTVTGSYYGQPITEETGQHMVPQWRSAQW